MHVDIAANPEDLQEYSRIHVRQWARSVGIADADADNLFHASVTGRDLPLLTETSEAVLRMSETGRNKLMSFVKSQSFGQLLTKDLPKRVSRVLAQSDALDEVWLAPRCPCAWYL